MFGSLSCGPVMRRMVAVTALLALLMSGAARTQEQAAPSGDDDAALRAEAAAVLAPLPPAPPVTNTAAVELGRMLYFDPRLSRSQAISCNSCHNLGLGGVDLQSHSIGHGWRFGGRNAPTVLNAVFHIAQFWDGRAADLADQAKGPIANPVEMANTHDATVATLKAIPGYHPLFRAAFPEADEPVTIENVARAIAAFEATLVTPDASFDRWLNGDDAALSPEQKRGLQLFIDTGCASCHNGPLLGGNGYQKFGVVEMPDERVLPRADRGRQEITGDEADAYVFKVPSLRNIALTRPYFHSGAVWDLAEAVRIMARSQLGVALGDADAKAITAFLRSLTGRQPEVAYPVLPPSVDGTPRPDVER